MNTRIAKKGFFVLTVLSFAIANHLTNFTQQEYIAYTSKNASRTIAAIDEKELDELLAIKLFTEGDIKKYKEQVAKIEDIEKLKKLGAKAKKSLPEKIIKRAQEDK